MRALEYDFQDTADGLLARLAVAASEDRQAEAKAKKLGILAGFSLLLSILLVFANFFKAAGFVLVSVIVWLVFYKLTKAHDLENRKVEMAAKLLKMIRADAPAQEQISLKIDFRGYKEGGEVVDAKSEGFGSTVQKFRDPWLALVARLADGNVVRLDVTDDVTLKSKRKRKYTKERERFATQVDLSLRPQACYGDPTAIAGRLKLITPPRVFTLKGIRVNESRIHASFETGPMLTVRSPRAPLLPDMSKALTAEDLLGVLMWAYRGLRKGTA